MRLRNALSALCLMGLLVACADSSSTPSAPAIDAADWPRCEGDEFSVAYPPGWFVHPPDDAHNVGSCNLFAAQPFELRAEDDGGRQGVQVSMWSGASCVGGFESIVSTENVEVGGYRGSRQVMQAGEGANAARAYQYVVSLRRAVECELQHWFMARTESNDPGSFEENAAILDEMMSTVEFED